MSATLAFALLAIGWAVTRVIYQMQYRHTHRQLVLEKAAQREQRVVWTVGITVIPVSLVWLATPWIDFAQMPWPIWTTVAGMATGVMALALFVWTHRALRANWSPVLQIRSGHELVTSGPYRWLAHPMYSAMTLGVVSNVCLTANYVLAVLQVAGLAILLVVRLRDEEKMMEYQFGGAYRQFLETRWRLVPLIW